MSTILLWTPPENYYNPVAHVCKLLRNGQVIDEDIPFNIAEDEHPAVTNVYTVVYYDRHGRFKGQVCDENIDRYERPTTSCKVLFNLLQPNGMPDAAAIVQITNNNYTTYCDRLITNKKGYTFAILNYNEPVSILLQGKNYELQCVIPEVQEIDFSEIQGSWVVAERRGRV